MFTPKNTHRNGTVELSEKISNTSETLFWQIAHSSGLESIPITPEVEAEAERLVSQLQKMEIERVAIFRELRRLYAIDPHFLIQEKFQGLCGYWSGHDCQKTEVFSPAELAELNSKGTLSEPQHFAVCNVDNIYQLPLQVDRIMSRRELSKALGWSNDKISARLKLEREPLPVLEKGGDGKPDRFSAMMVYRWLLRREHARSRYDDSEVNDWRDAKGLGDLKDNYTRDGYYPCRLEWSHYDDALAQNLKYQAEPSTS